MINKKLYMLTQYELINYICEELTERKIAYSCFQGNIWSITHIGSPLFMAHLDTVSDLAMNVPLSDNGIILKRKYPAILGADDRAGVDAILQHADNINFAFFVDEEIGAKGSSAMCSNFDFSNDLEYYEIYSAIELDRKGNSDIIGDRNDYCCEDLTRVMEVLLKDLGYKGAMGVFSDTDNISELIPCVNISIGYYGQHGTSEFLNIEDFEAITAKIPYLHKMLTGIEFTLPTKKYKGYYDFLREIK